MPEFNRRKFLIASAGVGAVGVVGGVGELTLPDLLRHSQKQPTLAAGSGILVIITLRRRRRNQHRDPVRRQCLSRRQTRTGLCAERGAASRRTAGPEPGTARAEWTLDRQSIDH